MNKSDQQIMELLRQKRNWLCLSNSCDFSLNIIDGLLHTKVSQNIEFKDNECLIIIPSIYLSSKAFLENSVDINGLKTRCVFVKTAFHFGLTFTFFRRRDADIFLKGNYKSNPNKIFDEFEKLKKINCNKVIFFDYFEYKSEYTSRCIKSLNEKGLGVLVYIVMGTRNFSSVDVDTEKDAVDMAIKEYRKEGYCAEIFKFNTVVPISFFSSTSISAVLKKIREVQKDVNTLKTCLDFFKNDYADILNYKLLELFEQCKKYKQPEHGCIIEIKKHLDEIINQYEWIADFNKYFLPSDYEDKWTKELKRYNIKQIKTVDMEKKAKSFVCYLFNYLEEEMNILQNSLQKTK